MCLQVLEPEQRRSYAERWSELESTLGRRSFHRLLDHLRTVQTAGQDLDQSSYQHPTTSSSSSSSALSLLEHFAAASRSAGAAVQVLNLLLEYGGNLLQLRLNDWRKLAAEGGTGESPPKGWCEASNKQLAWCQPMLSDLWAHTRATGGACGATVQASWCVYM